MVFTSRFPKPNLPSSDVFNYIFHHGRRNYPWSRVIYNVDQTDEKFTLAELEEKSRCFASVLTMLYNIAPGDVVSIFARDDVRFLHLTTRLDRRGRRYAYLAAGGNTSNGHSNGHAYDGRSTNGLYKDSAVHSALTILSSPGDGLLTSKNGGLHVIPAQEPTVALALLGKLYPENVVLLSKGGSPAAVEKAGKSFEPKVVIVGGSTVAVPKAAFGG